METNASKYTEVLDTPYTRPGDNVRQLDMYLPDTGRPVPALVFFHGGGLENGNRKGESTRVLKTLAGRGIGIISADYRLYPNARFPDFIQDAAAAVAFTANYGREHGLFSKIYIGGSSAGAYLAMQLCFNKKYLSDAGVKNREISGYVFDSGQPTVHLKVLRERGQDERRILIDEAAPLYYLDEAFINSGLKPEMFFIAADNDMPCRYEQNRLMVKNLEHFGYDMSRVAFRLMEGYSHTSYVTVQNSGGSYIYADMIERFILNGAAGVK